ncbi:hypothetical protein F5Y17DRAFT_428098 [Xylariaceae sp. FL0594]|nr:hypothetical protein F5Y17DRAFT_428098 [Xylariaceae sp. FL0594]
MSRPSQSSSGRNLTLTEELERLEQSITLTLQEIDHNFSKAHRIVTTSILPLVEQYGEHSKNVWEASKFWKQFFEASANVSLSGYEELAEETMTVPEEEETTLEESTSQYRSTEHEDDDITVDEPSSYHDERGRERERERERNTEDSLLLEEEEEDATITGSTPRPPARFAGFDSPYQALRREFKEEERNGDVISDGDDDDTTQLPPQPELTSTRLPDMSMTPRSYMLDNNNNNNNGLQSTARKTNNHNKDLLLHRVLDKTYRLQATPLKNNNATTWRRRGLDDEKRTQHHNNAWDEDNNNSPMSSPELAVPKLRSHMYMSPLKKTREAAPPRTPGVSVQTPNKKRDHTTTIFADKDKGKGKEEIKWESSEDDDDDIFGDMSPPKTIQFNLPPSRLLQTPAREASRRIVDDILREAEDDFSGEYSPTVVRMSHDILDDTF